MCRNSTQTKFQTPTLGSFSSKILPIVARICISLTMNTHNKRNINWVLVAIVTIVSWIYLLLSNLSYKKKISHQNLVKVVSALNIIITTIIMQSIMHQNRIFKRHRLYQKLTSVLWETIQVKLNFNRFRTATAHLTNNRIIHIKEVVTNFIKKSLFRKLSRIWTFHISRITMVL